MNKESVIKSIQNKPSYYLKKKNIKEIPIDIKLSNFGYDLIYHGNNKKIIVQIFENPLLFKDLRFLKEQNKILSDFFLNEKYEYVVISDFIKSIVKKQLKNNGIGFYELIENKTEEKTKPTKENNSMAHSFNNLWFVTVERRTTKDNYPEILLHHQMIVNNLKNEFHVDSMEIHWVRFPINDKASIVKMAQTEDLIIINSNSKYSSDSKVYSPKVIVRIEKQFKWITFYAIEAKENKKNNSISFSDFSKLKNEIGLKLPITINSRKRINDKYADSLLSIWQ